MTSAASPSRGIRESRPGLRRATGRDELLTISDHDPFLRWSLSEEQAASALIGEGAVVVERHRKGRHALFLVPIPGRDATAFESTLVAAGALIDERGVNSLSVPQHYGNLLATHYDLGDGGNWDWMWVTEVPDARVPEHDLATQLVILDDASDAEEITDFTHAHNTRVWTEIGNGSIHTWVGIRGPDGSLVAVGGAEVEDSGVPHLAGIVTDTGLRGHGLGSRVSAALTHWALERYGVCTLGMFSDNGPARTLYERLGYRTAHAWFSRRLSQD